MRLTEPFSAFHATPAAPAPPRHAPDGPTHSPRSRSTLRRIRGPPSSLPPAQQSAERQPDYARDEKAPTGIAADLIFDVCFQSLRLHLAHVISRAFQPTGSSMPEGRDFGRLTRSISLLMKRRRR